MKRHIIIFIGLGLILSCSGGSDDPGSDPTPTPPVVNNAPTVPTLIGPTNELNCTDNPLDFSWNASTDPDGDGVTYYVQVATNSSFSENLQVLSTSSTTVTFTLLNGVAYYWRVNAKDTKNKTSAYASTWKFYSEGEGVSNHLPYAATAISPVLNAEIDAASTALKWSASDADDDTLTYDVYFGNTNAPGLVAENITATSYDVNLTATTTYYWKIVVKDEAGGEAIGQIWSFQSK